MMDVLNVDILNEIFKDGDINGALRWGFTNKRNIEMLHKTKIYKDWYILGSSKIVVDYKMHYELFKFYIEDLIEKIRKDYNEKDSDYDPVILNKKLHLRISYLIRLCLSCNNFDMFKYFIDNVEKYISSCGDSLLKVISKILCKYCNDMRYFKKVYHNGVYLKNMINEDMVKYCECPETFDKYQREFNNPIEFTDNNYNLYRHLNTTILKHILNTYPDNTVDGTIDNIVEYFRSYTNNWVNHGNTKFILTLIETINNNDKLKNRYINDLFLHACGYKNIKYIEDVYDADLIDKETIIEGIKNCMIQNNSVFEIWAFFDGCLNIEDIGYILKFSILHSRKKIARYIKNKYYDGLTNYYDNIDNKKIRDLIGLLNIQWSIFNIAIDNHNNIIGLTLDMFNENKIYPLLLKIYSNNLTKYSKKIIRKLLSYVNFTDDNKNKHLALLKLFVLNDQFYILTKYEKYECEQSKKNHMFIDLVVFMKDYKMDMDKIVMICKMIQ